MTILINHLVLTPRLLVKGTVATGDVRLTTFLQQYRRAFLQLEGFCLLDFTRGERTEATFGSLRTEEIVLAHEFLELGGDQHRRALAKDQDSPSRMALLTFRGSTRFEVVGEVSADDLRAPSGDGFFVVRQPQIRGLEVYQGRDFDQLRSLSYAIVNRSQIQCVVEYD